MRERSRVERVVRWIKAVELICLVGDVSASYSRGRRQSSLERCLYCFELLGSSEIDLVEEDNIRCSYLTLSFVVDALGSWISELLQAEEVSELLGW